MTGNLVVHVTSTQGCGLMPGETKSAMCGTIYITVCMHLTVLCVDMAVILIQVVINNHSERIMNY